MLRFTQRCALSSSRSRVLSCGAAFSTSAVVRANRALIYTDNGDPTQVLKALTYASLPSPPAQSINIRFLLSPINPSDLNTIEGVYPAKPTLTQSLNPAELLDQPVYVPGHEGVAEVLEVAEGVQGLAKGDWVVMNKSQMGTWSSARTVGVNDVLKIPADSLSDVTAATLTVNPLTAYNLLRNYVDLQEGDWVLQNGANSAVGQAVIQVAARRGLKTINFVRNRDNIEELKEQLSKLGATHVCTYEDLADKNLRRTVKSWTEGKPIRLMLNCVGGEPTAKMIGFLGPYAHLVSYGAMMKRPLMIPTSAFIFKNLTAHGYWQNRWFSEQSRAGKETLIKDIIDLKLKEPEHEILTLGKYENDGDVAKKVQNAIVRMTAGKHGKKVLLKIEQPET